LTVDFKLELFYLARYTRVESLPPNFNYCDCHLLYVILLSFDYGLPSGFSDLLLLGLQLQQLLYCL